MFILGQCIVCFFSLRVCDLVSSSMCMLDDVSNHINHIVLIYR